MISWLAWLALAASPPVDGCAPAALDRLEPEHRERVAAVCSLCDGLKAQYIGMVAPWRHADGGFFDAAAQANWCVQQELATERAEGLELRLRRCIAGFHDSHLTLERADASLNGWSLPFRVEEAGGALIITVSRAPALPIGATLVSVDGEAAEAWVRRETLATSGSSEATARQRASRRAFRIDGPRPAPSVVKASSRGEPITVKVEWLADSQLGSRANEWFRRDAIVPWSAAALLETWGDDNDGQQLVLGELESRSRPFCYLQLNSLPFGPVRRTLSREVSDSTPLDPRAVIRTFLAGCERARRPLVLVLLDNPGGAANTFDLAHALAPPGTLPQVLLGIRATPLARSALQRATQKLTADEAKLFSAPALRLVDEALDAGRPLATYRPEPPPGRVFSGRTVALIGPGCRSGCDTLAKLLEHTPNVTLAGSPTAGAGYATLNVPVTWSSDQWSVELPMLVQAFAPRGYDGGIEGLDEAQRLEHHGAKPKVPYLAQPRDLTAENAGWWELTERLLFDAADGGP